ncbi:MAG: hypothetical protein H8D26_05170 [Methanomicrobia archaeon]|nr:hypothetical protein [Methanomicrobia archaeon]
MSEEAIKELKAKRDAAIQVQDEKWQREIEQLEQRVEEHTDLDIGNGVKIAIYTRLNEKRKKHYVRLIKELQSLGTRKEVDTGEFDEKGMEIKKWKIVLSESDEKRGEEIGYEIIEFATLNPMFTVTWFKDNPDKFALEDLLNNIVMYYNLQAIRWTEQAVGTKSFRTKPGGTKLR